MRNTLRAKPAQAIGEGEAPSAAPRRSLANLLGPLDQIAADSASLIANREARFEVGGEPYFLPQYIFVGPRSGDTPIRIGIFATIQGDEPEGAFALVRFLQSLERYPDMALGYCLSVYPICNPTGYEDYTRHSRAGSDLHREFWEISKAPELVLLQAELASRSFHGVIFLRSEAACDGFYGNASSATLAEDLLGPALRAAEEFLPLDRRARIEGFPMGAAPEEEVHHGIRRAPPVPRPRSFEINLEAPKHQPAFLTESAFVAALHSILAEYRKFIAYAHNL